MNILQGGLVHYHPVDSNQAYCEVHGQDLILHGEMMYVCGCKRGEEWGCCVCEEHDDD
jgi:hypothetical protein